MRQRLLRILLLLSAFLLASLPGTGQAPRPQSPRPRTPRQLPTPAIPTPLLRQPAAAKPRPAGNPMLYGVNVVWGDNGGNAGWERGGRAQRLVALMKEAGVTNTRIGIAWADVERERGKYDWRSADRLLRFVKGQGFVLTCMVSGTPDWAGDPDPAVKQLLAERGYAPGALAPAPQFADDFGRFVFEMGKRYKDIVHRWEFWQEPDGRGMPVVVRDARGRPTDLRPGDPAAYTRLLKVFAQNLKRAEPGCLVAVGGLATPRTDFLQGIYANGGRTAFDAVALHPAGASGPLAFDWIDACRQVMVNRGDERKKIWLTEWGWNTYPGGPGGIVEGQQAKLVRQSLQAMRQRGFLDQASLTALNDWRENEKDPLSQASMGLASRDLRPKPAFEAFRAEARGLSAPTPAARRPALFTASLASGSPVAVSVHAGRIEGALAKVGRGITLDGTELPAYWPEIAPRLKAAGVTLARVTPFRSPNAVLMAPDGSLRVRWEEADTLLEAVAAAGADAILALTPQSGLSAAAWNAFVTQAAQRYGRDARFRVARWELAAPAEGARSWYESFARAVRAALPATPVGFLLTEGDAIAGAQTLAELCAEKQAPCDSFAWRAGTDPTQEARTVRRLRLLLASAPALRSLTLWPEIAFPDDSPDDTAIAANLLATLLRLTDYAPTGQPNALGSALVSLSDSASGRRAAFLLLNALDLLNAASGARLQAVSDDSSVRCLAARSAGGALTLLLWREDGGAETRAARVRFLEMASGSSLRLEQFLIDRAHASIPPRPLPAARNAGEKPAPDAERRPAHSGAQRVAVADLFPGGAGETAVEVPLALAPNAVTLIRLAPRRAPSLRLTLSGPKGSYVGGDGLLLTVSVKNLTGKPQRATVQIASAQPGLIPPNTRTALSVIPPNSSRAVRYALRAPLVGRDTHAYFTASALDSSASGALRLIAPMEVTLETPRVDVPAPRSRATLRVRVTNRGKTTLPLTLRVQESEADTRVSEPVKFDAPAGKQTVQEIEASAPATASGLYPVEIAVEDALGLLVSRTAWLGVPALCRYAAATPHIDGDLSEWTDADPIGMGRQEQVKDKIWRGPGDLSAYAYAKWDEKYLYFACAVTDDAPFQPFPAGELWRGDSVQFALAADRSTPLDRSGYGPGDHEFGIALLSGNTPTLHRFAGPAGSASGPVPQSLAAVRQSGGRAYYEAAIPWSSLNLPAPKPGTVFGFSVLVNDNDGEGRGYVEWGGGIAAKNPALFPPLRLVK